MESFRRYLFKLACPGFRAVRPVEGIILANSRARVLDVDTEVIVLVLNAVRILHFRVGIGLDLSDGRLNSGLRDGCEDNWVTVRVGWVGVRRGRGHVCGSEWDVRRVTGKHGGAVIGGRRCVREGWTITVVARGGTGEAIIFWI